LLDIDKLESIIRDSKKFPLSFDSYKKLFDIMERRGLKKYWLRQNGINPKVVDALKNNRNVNVSTILDLCRLLDCQPGDIMEYIPDELSNS